MALFLAVVGVYGVISYSVSQRTKEIGIRMALGAGRKDILKLIMKYGLMIALLGITVGLSLSIMLSRILRGTFHNLAEPDLSTLGFSAIIFTIVVLVASFIPAWLASRVNPNVAVRHE